MARYESDWDRERERERDRERDYDRDRNPNEFGGRREGERRYPDIGRSNEYGSHAGWGGQGFSQGSFGSFGGQGERLYTQHGGQGYGAQAGYSARETGGGMGTYQGPGSGQNWNTENYAQGRGSERWGNQRDYRDRYEDRERYEDRGRRETERVDWGGPSFGGYQAGWSGYGNFDRDRRDFEHGRNEYHSDRNRDYERSYGGSEPGHGGSFGLSSSGTGYGASGSQGWAGRQQGYPGSARGGQHFGRGPKGYQRSDERIREDINERLTDHPDVDASEIEVEVSSGIVTLKGTVDERHSKRIAEDIAEAVSGVRDVQNQIHVSRGVWGSIKDTLTGGSSERKEEAQGQNAQPGSRTAAPTHTITPSPQQETTGTRR